MVQNISGAQFTLHAIAEETKAAVLYLICSLGFSLHIRTYFGFPIFFGAIKGPRKD